MVLSADQRLAVRKGGGYENGGYGSADLSTEVRKKGGI